MRRGALPQLTRVPYLRHMSHRNAHLSAFTVLLEERSIHFIFRRRPSFLLRHFEKHLHWEAIW